MKNVKNAATAATIDATSETAVIIEPIIEPIIETPNDAPSEVPTKEAQLQNAINLHLLGEKKNKSAFSKAYFSIFGTNDTNIAAHKKQIIAILEENGQGVVGSAYNSIGNDYKFFRDGVHYASKQAGSGTTVKAKTEKPTEYTDKQKATLETLADMFGVDSPEYLAVKTKADADLNERQGVWLKETLEADKKSKSVFVKNFVRTCNDIAFLNSIFELCKTEEAKQAMQEANRTALLEDTQNDDL
jgi:hypothetical protein